MPKAAAKSHTKASRPKDPKAYHLYTDDNPATTIHGTGFKDKAAAERTLELIAKRSLIYQFQTVNTMYNRAKHHPSMKKKVEGSAGLADMKAAMSVFRTWLDETYPAERDALRARGFKPLLSKTCVEHYLKQIEKSDDISVDAKSFAGVYVALPKGKKLGNVLVDNRKPTEPDWEKQRYESLSQLVPSGSEDAGSWGQSDLWTDSREVTSRHLELIAWAWSPVSESALPKGA